MNLLSGRSWALALGVVVLCGGLVLADGPKAGAEKKPGKEAASFGILEAMPPDVAQAKALGWFKATGKADDEGMKAFEAIWSTEKAPLEKVTETLILGDPEAKKLLDEARDVSLPAPTAVPAILKDGKKPAFFRANLALAYARALAQRRIHEEALEALAAVKVEDAVDPSTYLFHKAVAEYAMIRKDDARRTILRLLDDVVDAPERYKMVAAMMHFDMASWQDKDLSWVERMQKNIERRLDLSRGGPITQDMQKKVVLQLDEMIKKLEEERQKQQQACNKPSTQPRSNSPKQDSTIFDTTRTPGEVDIKKWKEVSENWGKLPEKERAKAMLELTRDMPPKYRELIETYFKKLAQADTGK
jgi:hypothetical protein